MFDWLWGNNTKKELDQTGQQLKEYGGNIAYNREMAGAMDSIMKDPANKDLIATVAAQDPQFMTNWLNQTRDMRRQANFGDIEQRDLQSKYDTLEKKNRYNYFGDGLLGSILNPIGQTISAGVDLATGQYANNKRDVASDVGAGLETALTLLPGAGGAMKAMKLGKAGAAVNGAINSIPGMALTGAGFGAADAYRQGGQNTQPFDVLGGAAMGGLFGGGISAASKVGNNFIMNRGLKRQNVSGVYDALTSSGINPYQASLMAVDENALRRAGMRSLVPQSTFGKVALGGGLLYGGSRLLNSGGEQQPMNYNDYSSMAQDPYAQYGMGY